MRSKENLDSPIHTMVLVVLVAGLSYLSMTLGSGMSVPPHNVSPLWPTNAVVLIVLLAVPRRLWPILITTAYGVVGLRHVFGAPIAVSFWLTLGNAVEVIVAAFGVRYFFKSVPRLNSGVNRRLHQPKPTESLPGRVLVVVSVVVILR